MIEKNVIKSTILIGRKYLFYYIAQGKYYAKQGFYIPSWVT